MSARQPPSKLFFTNIPTLTDSLPPQYHTDNLIWKPVSKPSPCWKATIPLNDLKENVMLLPTFSMLTPHSYGYEFSLKTASQTITLLPINHSPPSFEKKTHQPSSTDSHLPEITSHIDYFHLHTPAHSLNLELSVFHSTSPQEHMYLTTVSERASTLPASKISAINCALSNTSYTNLPLLSQYETLPVSNRDRVCSPTSLTMLLQHFIDASIDLNSIIKECYDEQHDLFGIWPKAVWTASQYGLLAHQQLFEDEKDIAYYLNSNRPIMASVQFEENELPGSFIPRSDGHLLVICGISDNNIVVNDPSAPSQATVRCSYPKEAFLSCWLKKRGFGIVLHPIHDSNV